MTEIVENDPPSPLAPLFTPEEADELSELMLSFDGGMLDFGELDGFLSALAVAPQPTTLERWWGALFGPEPEWEAEHEPAPQTPPGQHAWPSSPHVRHVLVPPADYFPGIWATNVVADTLWGIPWYVDTRLMYYRSDLLRAAGDDDGGQHGGGQLVGVVHIHTGARGRAGGHQGGGQGGEDLLLDVGGHDGCLLRPRAG